MREDISITDFGAIPDGITDSSAAIQRAIDKAAETQAAVYVPAGVYRCQNVQMRPHVVLRGTPAWSYHAHGGSLLELCENASGCLLDITHATGARISGLCLEGGRRGDDVHGIAAFRKDFPAHEDGIVVEDCRVNGFSGCGLLLDKIWCVSVRHSQCGHNRRHGIYWNGWDGFLLDNWLSGNSGAGFYVGEWLAAVTMTGCRIEWNRLAGVFVSAGTSLQMTGCYMDRNGGPGIWIASRGGYETSNICLTGNILNRNGAEDDPQEHLQCHIFLEGGRGIVCSSNACKAMIGDPELQGKSYPAYGVVLGELADTIVKDNNYHRGVTKRFLHPLDDACAVIEKDNIGSLAEAGAMVG